MLTPDQVQASSGGGGGFQDAAARSSLFGSKGYFLDLICLESLVKHAQCYKKYPYTACYG